ncbi:MAG: lipoprotein-releasing ABC transporter permease subunit [Holosporaceae bacterium]|jgi:lipoprotein-releasing system permease protein|nr:lipoprotein-releasing ABC transporter permease subunit [Holosporaceae bacterium]
MLGTELRIAWRYMRSDRKDGVISAIAAFSLVGIALGVATLIIVTSVMNGFRKEFTERVIGFNGHIAMYPLEEEIDYKNQLKDIASVSGIKQAIPIIERHALISNGKTVVGSLCNGISPEDLLKKDIISKNIVDGDIENFSEENWVIVGESLARRSRLQIGSDIVMLVPEFDETGFGFVPRKKTFRLAAVFRSGMHEYDKSISFISLEIAQKLFKMHKSIGTISVFLDDPLAISKIKDELVKKFPKIFHITDWQNSNSSFMKAVEIERNVMFLILTLIILVASFNIISCMMMLVKNKEKDIAILKTIGISSGAISRIFFLAGTFIGVAGTTFGTILGLLFSLNIQKIQAALESLLSVHVFSPEVYFLTHLPSLLRPVDVIITVAVSLLLSCLSTIYPARRASRLNPVEILRYA